VSPAPYSLAGNGVEVELDMSPMHGGARTQVVSLLTLTLAAF
jgi:hypothetical protein